MDELDTVKREIDQLNQIGAPTAAEFVKKVTLVHVFLSQVAVKTPITWHEANEWEYISTNLKLPSDEACAYALNTGPGDLAAFFAGVELLAATKPDNTTDNLIERLAAMSTIVQNWEPKCSPPIKTWLDCCKLMLIRSKQILTWQKIDLIGILPSSEIDYSEVQAWFDVLIATSNAAVSQVFGAAALAASRQAERGFGDGDAEALGQLAKLETENLPTETEAMQCSEQSIKQSIAQAVRFMGMFDFGAAAPRNGMTPSDVLSLACKPK